MRPAGRFPNKGDHFKNPDLANTLEMIAKEGRDAFYRGRIADIIVEHIHYFTEVKKLVYADRSEYYGDPEFSDLPIEELLSKEYAAERRSQIRDEPPGSK